MTYCHIPTHAIDIIAECLKLNSTLLEFSISWDNNDVVFTASIQSFDISCWYYKMGDTGSKLLAAFLHSNINHVMKNLVLPNSSISDIGAIALSEYITEK